jgi:hypothetical protein
MKQLDELSQSSKNIWLWGISSMTLLLIGQKPQLHKNLKGFIDRDKNKQRRSLFGKPIEDPERLKSLGKNDTVLLMVYGAEDSMESYLKDIDFPGEVLTLKAV